MEARDRIDGAAIWSFCLQEVMRGERLENAARVFGRRGIVDPAPFVERGKHGALLVAHRHVVRRLHPEPEARDRRKGDECLESRQLALQLLDHLLDKEVAEGNSGKPGLTVGK